jgi:Tfp pilus assembly protein PilX
MEFVLAALVLIGIVAFVVLNPLRKADERTRVEDDRRAALEAAKEAKYREIRDAELDFRMGKLSEQDWRETDRELRAQAIEILRGLDDS